ncbi:MAG: chaperone modulator CbpM [Ramlibacter sp.]
MNAPSSGIARPQRTRKDVVTQLTTLSITQVAQLSGVAADDLQGLMDHGVLLPVSASTPLAFGMECVMTLQRANALREDLALDGHSFALAMMLMSRVADLEAQVRTAQADLRKGNWPLERAQD